MSKKPTVLMILDGFGLNDKKDANAVYEAKTPVIDDLMATYPFVKGNASGLSVGLPEGQMLSLIHISEPTRLALLSRMPSSA